MILTLPYLWVAKRKKKKKEKKSWQGKRKKTALLPSLAQGLDPSPKRIKLLNTFLVLAMVNFSGTAGDSFSYHNGWQFTTPDEDNDSNPDLNCALKYHGGWWFRKCHRAFLNGPYIRGPNSYVGEGIIWKAFKDFRYSLKSSQMKIRPRDF